MCVRACVWTPEGSVTGGEDQAKPEASYVPIYLWIDLSYIRGPPLVAPPSSRLSSRPLNIICCVCSLEKIKL